MNALRARIAVRLVSASTVALLGISLRALPVVADDEPSLPAGSQPGPQTAIAGLTDQFIVKFKEESGGSPADRKEVLERAAKKLGVAVRDLRETHAGDRVVRTARKLGTKAAGDVIASLEADPKVESVEPDARMYPTADPNDEYYPLQ